MPLFRQTNSSFINNLLHFKMYYKVFEHTNEWKINKPVCENTESPVRNVNCVFGYQISIHSCKLDDLIYIEGLPTYIPGCQQEFHFKEVVPGNTILFVCPRKRKVSLFYTEIQMSRAHYILQECMCVWRILRLACVSTQSNQSTQDISVQFRFLTLPGN